MFAKLILTRVLNGRFHALGFGAVVAIVANNVLAQPSNPNIISGARSAINKINQLEAESLAACAKEFQTNACKARVKQQFSQERLPQQKLIVNAQREIREERAAQANERVRAAQAETKTAPALITAEPKRSEVLLGKPRPAEQEQATQIAKAQERFEAKQKKIAQRAAVREAKLQRPIRLAREPKK